MALSDTTVLWRVYRTGRDHARAVILQGGPPFTIAFFTNDDMERVENYDTMDVVLFRADDVKRILVGDGWVEDEERRMKNEERNPQ